MANIAGYYGKQVGVTGIGATNEESGLAHYSPNDNGIWITPGKDGYVPVVFNNKYNLICVLEHENFHKQDHSNGIDISFETHAMVYAKQIEQTYVC